MYPGDWESLTKSSSPLAAGLVEDEGKKKRDKEKRDREREERPALDRHKSKEFEPNARGLQRELRDGDEDLGKRHSDKDSLLRQVKRMIVERVQHELSKVDSMIQERIDRETLSLRLQMEALQRDVAWLRGQAHEEPPQPEGQAQVCPRPCHRGCASQQDEACAGKGATRDDLLSVNNALKKAKQGIEAQVSDLWTQIAAMQEGLEVSHLRHKLRFVATSMLALGAADLSPEEKDVSKRALQEEEAALKERMQALIDRLSRQRNSQASDLMANGVPSSNTLLPSPAKMALTVEVNHGVDHRVHHPP